MKIKPLKIMYGLFVFCLVIIVLVFIFSALPITGNYRILAVLSGSMEPTIHTGSIIISKPMDKYKEGDIITFGKIGKNQTPTTHRIVEIKDKDGKAKYITKGDANNSIDQKQLEKSEIFGKVLLDVPLIGYAINAAQKPVGFLLIVVVPAVILIYDEMLNIKKEILKKLDYKKRMKKRKETEVEKEEYDNDNNKKENDEKKEE